MSRIDIVYMELEWLRDVKGKAGDEKWQRES